MKYFESFYFDGKWELQDEIIKYNKQDCENLYLLHQWLLEQKANLEI